MVTGNVVASRKRWKGIVCVGSHEVLFVASHRRREEEKRMAEQSYCVKCKEKREMKDSHQITMKNGKTALQGICVVCGTKLTRILSSQKA
jgi:Domain of unknown function (DUF5679)